MPLVRRDGPNTLIISACAAVVQFIKEKTASRPAIILLFLCWVRVLFVLQPEIEPVDVPNVDLIPVLWMVLNVQFIYIDKHFHWLFEFSERRVVLKAEQIRSISDIDQQRSLDPLSIKRGRKFPPSCGCFSVWQTESPVLKVPVPQRGCQVEENRIAATIAADCGSLE
jgi:hypothetical protein